MNIDFSAIAEHLLTDAIGLLKQWFPAGKLKGREYAIGNLRGDTGDSLNINIDSGKWHDLATSEGGGDLISLYAAIHGIKQSEAAKQLGNGQLKEDLFATGVECVKIPSHKHGRPSAVWEYKKDGETFAYVCRFDTPNEGKQFAPLTCWYRQDGKTVWKYKKWPGLSPLYGDLDNNKKVLIVEGEKTADAAQKLLPDWAVVTWPGGAGAVKQADWSALLYRYCYIWPDNDEAGQKAAQQLKKILPDLHIVTLPDGLPEGWDLADAPSDFLAEDYLKPQIKLAKINDLPAETPAQRMELILPHYDGKKILATLDNMRALLHHYKIIVRYNVITKRIFFTIPGETFSVENGEDAAFACIFSLMKQNCMPVDGYQPYLMRIADENQYNPVMEWIQSRAWDRVSRLQSLYDTIESPEKDAKELLIRRWMITAVCMAKGEGVDSAGCLVLQGGQDIGKTWWVRKLVPDELRPELIRTDANVNPADKDSVSQIISYWICELGEIGATFRKSDIDALKAFITRDHDTMRRPYGIGDKRYPRRTALIASVDQTIYLHDTAGNRRFWTVPCTAINSYHTIDMQQLWAEVLELSKKEGWQLQPDEKEHIARINESHMQIEPIVEMIEEKYYNENEKVYPTWKTATAIASEIGFKSITQRETRTIASYLRKRKVPFKEAGGKTLFLL